MMDFPSSTIPGTAPLQARLTTSLGEMIVQLEEQRAPNTVKNFVGLALGIIDWKDPKTGQSMQGTPCYDGLRFHRVVPNFMIQCGDPFSRYTDTQMRWGTGGPGYKFADEFHPELRHTAAGILSMVNSGPNTNGSQWLITGAPTPHLDNKNSVFGRVVSGLDVAQRIANVATTRDRPNQDIRLQKVEIFRK